MFMYFSTWSTTQVLIKEKLFQEEEENNANILIDEK